MTVILSYVGRFIEYVRQTKHGTSIITDAESICIDILLEEDLN